MWVPVAAAAEEGRRAGRESRAVLLRIARACVAAVGGLARGMVPALVVEASGRGAVPLVEAVAESEARVAGATRATKRVEAALGEVDTLLDEALARCKGLGDALDLLDDDLLLCEA